MKTRVSSVVSATFLWALFLVSVPGLARADGRRHCSGGTAAGKWALTSSGVLLLPTGAIQVSAVGVFDQDKAGNLSGTQTRSLNGDVAEETFTGKATVNSDCTSTYVVDVFAGGVLTRTTTLHIVFDNNSNSARGVFTSLILPNGVSVPTVITLDARKVFSD